MSELILRPRHVRAARICMPGARRWAAAHGIDWAAFVRNGLPVADMTPEVRNDPFMVRAIAELEKENG